jgi:hypothetical protein
MSGNHLTALHLQNSSVKLDPPPITREARCEPTAFPATRLIVEKITSLFNTQQLEDLDINGRMVLACILGKMGWKLCGVKSHVAG